jgi:hypothetical protein
VTWWMWFVVVAQIMMDGHLASNYPWAKMINTYLAIIMSFTVGTKLMFIFRDLVVKTLDSTTVGGGGGGGGGWGDWWCSSIGVAVAGLLNSPSACTLGFWVVVVAFVLMMCLRAVNVAGNQLFFLSRPLDRLVACCLSCWSMSERKRHERCRCCID